MVSDNQDQPEQLRQPAEVQYADQLEALRQHDGDEKPANWLLSPRAVFRYIVGGEELKAKFDGKNQSVAITRKFFGEDSLVERTIVTLASERALLLVGNREQAKAGFRNTSPPPSAEAQR